MNDKYKFLKDCFTGKDNQTTDLMRVLFAIAFIGCVGLEFVSVLFLSHPFNMVEFCGGVAALFTGTGVGLYSKKDTEPH